MRISESEMNLSFEALEELYLREKNRRAQLQLPVLGGLLPDGLKRARAVLVQYKSQDVPQNIASALFNAMRLRQDGNPTEIGILFDSEMTTDLSVIRAQALARQNGTVWFVITSSDIRGSALECADYALIFNDDENSEDEWIIELIKNRDGTTGSMRWQK